MKIVARRVPDEAVMPAFFDGEILGMEDFLTIDGNRHLCSYISETFEEIKNVLEEGELFEALDMMEEDGSCYFIPYAKYVHQIIEEYLPKKMGKCHNGRYNVKEILSLKKAIFEWGKEFDDEELAKVVSLVTGEKWEMTCIRGYSQGDWNIMYFIADKVDRDYIEALYFGMFEEWEIIQDGDKLESFVMRTFSFNPKSEIAEYFDISEDNVELEGAC